MAVRSRPSNPQNERATLVRSKAGVDAPHSPAAIASPYTAAEFFAGIGLVRLALEQQGWRVAFANDIDESKAAMYRRAWPDDDGLVVGDIHRLDVDSVPSCDLFTASFPCNDLSVAGRQQGLAGKESSAFWGLIRILNEMDGRRPPLVLLENVVGFLTSHDGADLRQALAALDALGYSLDALVLNARHWTPQSRPRLFVVAALDDDRMRTTIASESAARPAALCRFINAHPRLRWNLRQLPDPPPAEARLVDVLQDLPDDDPNWWSRERADYLMNQLSDKHAAIAERMIGGESHSYATAFRRVRKGRSMAELRIDGIAGCLRTPRGGSGRQILLKAGQGRRQVRLLTARECARLQGAPDDFPVDPNLNRALFGLGDAVCAPAVAWIVEHCLSPSLPRRSICSAGA